MKFNVTYNLKQFSSPAILIIRLLKKSRNKKEKKGWKKICSPTHSPFIKSTDISSPYVSLSQSSRIWAPILTPGTISWVFSLSSVYSIASNACTPPCGITGPHVNLSCLSCTIIKPPSTRSPSTTASFFTGQDICSRCAFRSMDLNCRRPWRIGWWVSGFSNRSKGYTGSRVSRTRSSWLSIVPPRSKISFVSSRDSTTSWSTNS